MVRFSDTKRGPSLMSLPFILPMAWFVLAGDLRWNGCFRAHENRRFCLPAASEGALCLDHGGQIDCRSQDSRVINRKKRE